MNIRISFFSNFHRNLGTTPLETVLKEIQNGTYAGSIQLLREALSRGESEEADRLKKRLPAFTVSAVYEGKRQLPNLVHYNPIVVLDFDKLAPEEVARAQARARELPYTLFCFRSPSGNGLKVGVRPVVAHPLTAESHRLTFKIVADWYVRELGIPVDASGKDVGRLCFVSHDPNAYIDLDKLSADLPLMDDRQDDRQDDNDEALPPGAAKKLSDARRQTTRKMTYAEGNRNNYVFLFALNCAHKGLDPEAICLYCRHHFADLPADEIRTAVQSAVQSVAEHKGEKEKEKDEQGLIHAIEQHLSKGCDFRFNLVTRRVEYRPKNTPQAFEPLDDRMENTLWCDLLRSGIDCYQTELHSLLTSAFSPAYDPFVSYFDSLPPWDGQVDYIAQLAATVRTTQPELWDRCLRKWLVAMVACATRPDVENHTVLILNSEQGTGKTTWCTNLIPPELHGYRYSGVPRFDSRDTMLTLSECILVNLDEMTTLSERDLNRLKELTSKSVIRERRAYGRNNETYMRRASFTASVNTNQILSDLTGSRRFLCFHATAIDYLSPIDHVNIYSQAVALLKSGFRFWLNDEDIREINENNEAFRIRPPEEELFYSFFRKCEDGETGSVWLTATQIMDRLCINSHLIMTHIGTVRLGILLQKDGFACCKKKKKNLYQVMEIPREEVDREKTQQPEESPEDNQSAEESPKDNQSAEESPKDNQGTEESPKDNQGTKESPEDNQGADYQTEIDF